MKYSRPSQRQLRVAEQIRHVVAQLLQRGELRDPFLKNIIPSVSEVRMSPDLKMATCFVTSLGNIDDAAVVKAINSHAKYIRGQVGRSLRELKYVPEFYFRLDTSFDNFARIDALLHSPEVARDLDHNKNNKE